MCQQCTARRTTCEWETAPGQTRATTRKSLLEMFWYLQTTSAKDAQDFLAFMRSGAAVGVETMQNWVQERQSVGNGVEPGSSQQQLMSDISPPTDHSADVAILDVERVADDPDPEADVFALAQTLANQFPHWPQAATVDTVRNAINMFFLCTGSLFHVFSRDEVDVILDELGDFQPEDAFVDVLTKDPSLQHNARIAEVCGMAAVGILYLRISDEHPVPPAELAEYFYIITRRKLDSAIRASPLRAMKVCALLAMYNIVLKGSVALAYVGQ